MLESLFSWNGFRFELDEDVTNKVLLLLEERELLF